MTTPKYLQTFALMLEVSHTPLGNGVEDLQCITAMYRNREKPLSLVPHGQVNLAKSPWDKMGLIKTTDIIEERKNESMCIRKADLGSS